MSLSRLLYVCLALAPLAAQNLDERLYSEMHWRQIGPPRAGRARALAGVPSQPNVFYIGFDNGGVWRSTDYGSTWVPLFDNQPTGSIGAIAVAPSDPNIIYVGTGAGIIRPDLAIGDGVYKSTDAGKTWTHLGLRDSQMIANIEVDPKNPEPPVRRRARPSLRTQSGARHLPLHRRRRRLSRRFSIRTSTPAATTSASIPANPNTVYAALWQQQQGFFENGAFGGTDGGIFKSTDGGSTWKKLAGGLPPIIEANLAIAPSNPKIIYATVAAGGPAAEAALRRRRAADAAAAAAAAATSPSTKPPTAAITGPSPPTIRASPKSAPPAPSAGYPPAGPHRRRRPAHHHRRPEERKGRL